MKFKRLYRYIAIVFTVGMLLSACTGSDGNPSEEPEKRPENVSSGGTESGAAGATESEDAGGTEDKRPEGTAGQTGVGKAIRLLHPLVTSRYRTYYNDNGDQFESAEWESIEFQEDEANAYPELVAAVREKFQQDEAWLLQNMEDSRDDAEAYMEDMSGDWSSCFTYERTVELQRCDSEVFSFTVLDYQFTGGAHGMYGYGGYSYDARTGKLLTAEDVFTDKKRLAQAIEETLISGYSPDAFFDSDGLRDMIAEYIDNGYLNMVLTNRGPRVMFNPYEIGPYSEGVFIANLYPEIYPDLVKSEYVKTAESWIAKLPADENLFVDVDGDGLPEDIRYSVNLEYGDDYSYSWITGFEIYVGDKQLSVSADANFVEGYFARDKGKSFLYLMQVTYNDYQILYAVDCTDKKITFEDEVCSLNAGVAVRAWEYDDSPGVSGWYRCSYTLTDPENMYLESRTDYLSTTSGNRMMHADEVGVPVPNEGSEYYRIENFMFDFTARRDVAGILIDDDGNEAGEYTIPAGAKVKYIRTDNETFGDVRTEDGKIVRFRMELEEWPHAINGIELEELFDGIIFAG